MWHDIIAGGQRRAEVASWKELLWKGAFLTVANAGVTEEAAARGKSELADPTASRRAAAARTATPSHHPSRVYLHLFLLLGVALLACTM